MTLETEAKGTLAQIGTDMKSVRDRLDALEAAGPGGGSSPARSFISVTGRMYCYADLRWVTDSDDNYGTAYYQFSESGGTGLDPIVEFEHRGHLVPKGTKLHQLKFEGRSNNALLTDVEIMCVVKHPDPITRWETGYDNDGEDAATTFTVLREFFYGPTGSPVLSGPSNDRHMRTFDLGGYEVPEDANLSLYMKPVGALVSTRYLPLGYTYTIEVPDA